MVVAALAMAGACSPSPDPRATAELALQRAPILDGHNDLAIHYARADPQWSSKGLNIASKLPGQSDIPRMRKGRVGGALVTVSSALDPSAKQHFPALSRSFDWFDRLVSEQASGLAKVTRAEELERARRKGRIGFIMGIEGGDQIDGSLDNLRTAYARGVRSMGVVYDHNNVLGDGAMAFPASAAVANPPAGGLTGLGREVIAEMNRLGMIVDLSHAADSTVEQALAYSSAPILFSHSAARALADSPRNLSDETLAAVRAKGGLVMVPLAPYLITHASWRWFLAGETNFARLKGLYPGDSERISSEASAWDRANPPPPVTLSDVADQIDYLAGKVGHRQVGIGSDFDGMGSFVIPELADAEALPRLFTELASRGWTRTQLEGLASGNFVRFFQAVERSSRERAASRGSSTPARKHPY